VPMRTFHIAYLAAGGFAHIRPYIDYFKQRGHQVSFIKYDNEKTEYGVPTYDISSGARVNSRGSKWKYLLAGIRIRPVLRSLKPDILHGHYITSAGIISLMSGFSPSVLTAHGSDVLGSLNSWVWRAVLKRVLASTALVNPVSSELAYHIESLGVSQSRILIASLGVDVDRFTFKPHQPDGRPWRLLCTRTLAEIYDPETILKACAILMKNGLSFTLTFAAGGPMTEKLKRTAHDLKVGGRVSFLGGYQNGNLPALLHAHDLYVSASRWDGTSISLLEAMACGIFPVISRIAANESWVMPGRTAKLFQCGNPDELARAVWEVAERPSILTPACQLNRELILRKADRQKLFRALETKYANLFGLENKLRETHGVLGDR
jgi:L-malate glycosyltransferase